MDLKIRLHHFLLMAIVCYSGFSFSQKEKVEQRGVLLQHPEKKKPYLVLEGYKVKVFTKDTNTYEGVLGIHDINTIVVGKDHVSIDNIKEFRGNNRTRTIGGKVTMLTGAGLLGAAVVTFIVTGEIEEITTIVKVMIGAGSAGVVLISTGAALYADKRKFKSEKGWTFSISGGETVKQ